MNNSFDIFSLAGEEFYNIFENMQEGVTVYRVLYNRDNSVMDLIIKYANPASTTSRVFLNKQFMGRSVTKLYGQEAVARLIEEVNEISDSGQIKKYETYSPLLDSYFSISAFLPAKNLYVTLTSDITEQKKAEKYLQNAHDDLEIKIQERTKELLEAIEEKEVLLNEIHHRVKNNLQMISSLINLQIPYINDENSVELFKSSQNRVRSISMVHNKLYQSKSLDKIEFSDYIRSIMTNLLQTYGVNQNKVHNNLDLESTNLNIETAIPCGIIITELVTNSIKHAFVDGREGQINVELQKMNDKKFILKITDNGVGFTDDFNIENPESFGLQLVILLVNQLRGTLTLNSEKETEFLIEFEELKYKERV